RSSRKCVQGSKRILRALALRVGPIRAADTSSRSTCSTAARSRSSSSRRKPVSSSRRRVQLTRTVTTRATALFASHRRSRSRQRLRRQRKVLSCACCWPRRRSYWRSDTGDTSDMGDRGQNGSSLCHFHHLCHLCHFNWSVTPSKL